MANPIWYPPVIPQRSREIEPDGKRRGRPKLRVLEGGAAEREAEKRAEERLARRSRRRNRMRRAGRPPLRPPFTLW